MMIAYYKKILFYTLIFVPFLLISCKNKESEKVYFGGEIINPNSKFLYLCKEDKVVDTITLDQNNRFLVKYDTLSSGMYTFRHEPEYQYMYVEKGDSLMIRLNAQEFDNSLTFCGRGDEKNNFLIELFLKNEEDKNSSFDIYDEPLKKFEYRLNKEYQERKVFYNEKKEEIDWNSDFDLYASSMLEMPYLTKKELYPLIHQFRTNKKVCGLLPKDYYDYRKEIDFNNQKLTDFAPFVAYLTAMLNNITCDSKKETIIVKNNIDRLKVADSIFTNKSIKNSVLHNIAFMYLLEDQNTSNNKAFLSEYYKLSTDSCSKNTIKEIANSIQSLAKNKYLPKIELIDPKGKEFNSVSTNAQKTVLFFWSSEAKSHLKLAYKKAMEIKKRNPFINFVAINIDKDPNQWKKVLAHHHFEIPQLHAKDFEDIQSKWVITKIHRAILLNEDKTIKNAFINIFDAEFDNYLK
ncbi:TlpA family protein disulfide reductase [Flavobacterium columnare]|nr:thioredoxin-like domain-containing protein [Flavobacterium columnare]